MGTLTYFFFLEMTDDVVDTSKYQFSTEVTDIMRYASSFLFFFLEEGSRKNIKKEKPSFFPNKLDIYKIMNKTN